MTKSTESTSKNIVVDTESGEALVMTASCSINPGRMCSVHFQVHRDDLYDEDLIAEIEETLGTYMYGELLKARGTGIPVPVLTPASAE